MARPCVGESVLCHILINQLSVISPSCLLLLKGFTNWFLLEGLSLHGKSQLQENIFNKWIALVEKSGIYEHYNPLTGSA